jgi:hypothetical protein
MTTTPIDPLATGIACSLEIEPELSFFTWKVQVQNLASSKATIVDTSGLLTLVLDDGEWNAHSANQLVGIGGAVIIAPRPVEPAHVPITAGMTNAQISVAKYTNDRHLIWHEARTSLKNEIIRSLGPTLASTIGPPPTGFTTITVPQIVAAVKGFYGTIDQLALNRMEDILAAPLDSVSNLDKHLANMRQHMLMQTTAGYPIEEHRKGRIFRKSVLGHHIITGIIADFDHENLDPLLHTYDLITAYVKKHLPNLRAAADMATSSGRALSVMDVAAQRDSASAGGSRTAKDMGHAELLCAFSVLEQKHKNLQQNQKRASKRNKDRGNGKDNKRTKTPPSNAPITAEDCTSYCHAHGHQSSHDSPQCKVMANQTQNFTPEMRKATGPNNPPGGSRLVRGREPTVVGQANMMTSFTDDNGEGIDPSVPVVPVDADENMRLYHIAFAAHRPEPNESNAESADRSRRIDDQVEALKREGGVLSQRTMRDSSLTATSAPPSPDTGFYDNEYINGKRTGAPPTTKLTNQRTGAPPTTELTNQEADSGKRTNQNADLGSDMEPPPPKRAHLVALSPPRVLGFLLREGDILTPTVIDIDLESPAECRRISDRIYRSLMFDNWKPDFRAHHIPSRNRDAAVHDTLSRMISDREKTEARLNELMTYDNPDGTRKDRNEEVVETEYERLNTRYNNFNRAMLTIYAQFLVADLPPSPVSADSALAAASSESSSIEPPRPYSHIRERPPPLPTVPQFETVAIDDSTDHALLTQRLRPRMPESMPGAVWAVADSGASHILIVNVMS